MDTTKESVMTEAELEAATAPHKKTMALTPIAPAEPMYVVLYDKWAHLQQGTEQPRSRFGTDDNVLRLLSIGLIRLVE